MPAAIPAWLPAQAQAKLNPTFVADLDIVYRMKEEKVADTKPGEDRDIRGQVDFFGDSGAGEQGLIVSAFCPYGRDQMLMVARMLAVPLQCTMFAAHFEAYTQHWDAGGSVEEARAAMMTVDGVTYPDLRSMFEAGHTDRVSETVSSMCVQQDLTSQSTNRPYVYDADGAVVWGEFTWLVDDPDKAPSTTGRMPVGFREAMEDSQGFRAIIGESASELDLPVEDEALLHRIIAVQCAVQSGAAKAVAFGGRQEDAEIMNRYLSPEGMREFAQSRLGLLSYAVGARAGLVR